jgi:hypothetical protein
MGSWIIQKVAGHPPTGVETDVETCYQMIMMDMVNLVIQQSQHILE